MDIQRLEVPNGTTGIDVVIRSMALVDEHLQLGLVGAQGDVAYSRPIRDLIDRLGLKERIRLHGPLQGEALARCYADADVFVLPSRSEAFGIVCAEAMSFGLPVIASRVGALPWLVEEGCGVLVPPGDSIALAEAMRLLATDADLRKQMGEAALRRSLRLPMWQDTGRQFHRLMLHLLHV